LNFALIALFLFSTVSMTKLRLTKADDNKPPVVTFNGYIKVANSDDLVSQKDISSGSVTFIGEDKKVYKATAAGNGQYQVTLPVGRYTRSADVKGYKILSENVCIRASANISQPKHTITLTLGPPPPPPDKPVELVKIRGLIKDATTNRVLADSDLQSSGATITFVDKDTNDSYNATLVNGSVYEVNLPAGRYTRTSSMKGMADMPQSITVGKGSDEKNSVNIIFLIPVVKGYRIVLTWGAVPLDLDAHVILPDGTEVNFDNRKSPDGHVTLDVDALKGFGPETVSFVDLAPGIYQFYVNRYTNEEIFTRSNARIVVVHIDRVVKEYRIPTSGDPTFDNWHVFNIDGKADTVTDVNQLKASMGPSG